MNLQIGNVTIQGNLILAPMAGVTDLPFRLLCKEQGADFIYTEMVSAKAITYQNKNTEALMEVKEEERPVALQLFGSDPEIMAEAARRIEHRNFDVLDINMGCPVPKVVNNGEGSALMKTPKLAGEIVRQVVNAIQKPVTVKIRRGFDKEEETAVELAKILEQNGASAVAVHGRTREQYYSGKANWEIIRKVRDAVSIPVIGNGDIFNAEDAKRMLEETGCHGIMIARGARGNPWIFKQIKTYLESGIVLEKPSVDQLIQMMRRHATLQFEYKGEFTGIREMRKHVAWYTTGYPKSSKLRNRVNEMEDMDSLLQLLQDYKELLQEHNLFYE